jgi:hypothetical protein
VREGGWGCKEFDGGALLRYLPLQVKLVSVLAVSRIVSGLLGADLSLAAEPTDAGGICLVGLQ